ncbi:MAG: SDR family oxidoreductase [Oscillochloris sp.]|nr:SDR family oxidoreductase [Oscillochloris sp.]
MALSGRVALVTGGGRGIGQGTALALARLGAAVALMARSGDQIMTVAELIGANGGRAAAFPGDVGNYADVEVVVGAVEHSLGPIDILINNAAIVEPIAPVAEVDPAAWARLQQINLIGAFHCIRAVLPGMLERGWGRIVNISSGAATGSGLSHGSAYSVSKAGLDMLARATAAETGARGVAVCSIYPGIVDTAMQADIRAVPQERAGEVTYQRFRDFHEQKMLNTIDAVGELIAAAALAGFNGEILDVRGDEARLRAALRSQA